MSLPTALVLLLASSTAAAAPVWPDLSTSPSGLGGGEKDAAVIVGIDRYAEVPAIPGAAQNADDWYTFLTASRLVPKSRVTLLRNKEATVEKLRKYGAEAAANVQSGGTLWFIFIGHGAPSKDGADGVLVGYDAQQDVDSLYARSLAQRELLALLGRGAQARAVVVLDACFSGRSASGHALVRGLQPLLPVALPGELSRTAVLTAGKGDQFAGPLPGASRPAFSYLLLGALRGWADRDGNRQVSLEEAHAFVRDALQTLVKDRSQTPEIFGDGATWSFAGGPEPAPDLGAFVLAGASGGSELDFGSSVEIRVPKVTVTTAAGLAAVNMQAEQLLEAALDAEEGKATADEKAAAWCKLAALAKGNPYAEQAGGGCTSWRAYANALRIQRLGLEQHFQTIAGYLRLKRKSKEQKLASVDAFLAVYRSLPEDARVAEVLRARLELEAGREVELLDRTEERDAACARGVAEDCHFLGVMHANGVWPFASDDGKALAMYRRACTLAYAPGCTALGQANEAGLGVAVSTVDAVRYYSEACEAGDGGGCFSLARLHLVGRGVPRDVFRALSLDQRACDLGERAGCMALGRLYAGTNEVTRDPAKSADAFSRACDAGESEGCVLLAELLLAGAGLPRDEARATGLYDKTCRAGRAQSCLVLGELLEPDGAREREALAAFDHGCGLGSGLCCVGATKLRETAAARAEAVVRAKDDALREAAAQKVAVEDARLARIVRAERLSTAGWVLSIGGGVLLGGSGVFGAMTVSELGAIRDGTLPTSPAITAAADDAATYRSVSLGLGTVGALALVPGLLLLGFADTPEEAAVPLPSGDGSAAAPTGGAP